jgi:rhodanese-related sulfurtransferase
VSPATRRILSEAAAIFLLGVLAGLAVHHRLVLDAFSGRIAAPSPAGEQAGPAAYPAPVGLAEVRELAAAGAVLVDARSRELYAEGHLPGARSLPLAEADARLDAFRREAPPEAVLVIYCSGYRCPDSFDLGVKLLAAGWRDVRVFEGGFPEWHDAGLPVEKGEP